jgi:DNA-binding NarL/FixJ family response regulator
MDMDRYRVLVADDHAASEHRVKAALPPQFEVVATVRSSDHHALSRTALKLKPDIILIHFGMAIPDGFHAVKDIFRHLPRVRIVFYPEAEQLGSCVEEASASVVPALEACGFITNETVNRAALGVAPVAPTAPKRSDQIVLDSASSAVCALEPDSTPSQEVTEREYEVLALLAAGHPMKRIAHRLGITYRTVTFHKYRMMERLGITTNAGLMTYALKRHMVDQTRQEKTAEAA